MGILIIIMRQITKKCDPIRERNGVSERENCLLLRPSRSNSTTTPSPREYKSKIELLHRWRRFDCHNELWSDGFTRKVGKRKRKGNALSSDLDAVSDASSSMPSSRSVRGVGVSNVGDTKSECCANVGSLSDV